MSQKRRGIHNQVVKFAPLLGVNVGYAYAGYVNPDETLRRFSGTGAIVSARAGALMSVAG